MATPVERRRRLFKLYSADLALYLPEHAGFCACPICGDAWTEAGVEPETLMLDLAHVYPDACGGTVETLTCRKCNNRTGRLYDHHVALDQRLVNALDGSGDGTVNVRARVGKASMGATMQRRGSHIHFEEVRKQSNPSDVEKIAAAITTGTPVQVYLDLKVPDARCHSVAIPTQRVPGHVPVLRLRVLPLRKQQVDHRHLEPRQSTRTRRVCPDP